MSFITHIEHIEDMALSDNLQDYYKVVDILEDIYNGITSKGKHLIKRKYDGAPALFFGKAPVSGEFFLSTKAVANKDRKLAKSLEDIDRLFSGKELQDRLKKVFALLSRGKYEHIFQADLMYLEQDVLPRIIDNAEYLIFQTNLLVYAIIANSEFGEEINKGKYSKMGLAIHTQYVGDDFSNMKRVDVRPNDLPDIPGVLFMSDKIIVDEIELAPLEKMKIEGEFEVLVKLIKRISEDFSAPPQKVLQLLRRFVNKRVREGSVPFMKNYNKEVDLFYEFAQYEEVGVGPTKKVFTKFYMEARRNQFALTFNFMSIAHALKVYFLSVIEDNIKTPLQTFVYNEKGELIPTRDEGFVVEGDDKTIYKIVNRSDFSEKNFNTQKPWQKDKESFIF